MELSPDQFERLITVVTFGRDDRDRLIRIDENLKGHLSLYDKDRLETVAKTAIIERTAIRAHDRIDRVLVIGGWTMVFTIVGIIVVLVQSVLH